MPITRRNLLTTCIAAISLLNASKVCAASDTIRFGLTPVFLDSDIQLLDTLKSYLSRAAGQDVVLIKRRTYQEITLMLLSGELDAAWICGFPFVHYQAQLSLLAVPLYQNEPLYQSYLIVNDQTAAETFSDMRGHTHAFSDPDSNSGFLVTRALLAEIDERPETFFARSFFTYGHRNVIRAVNSGLAQSGSVDGYVWDVMADIEPKLVANTRVIRKSEKMGFPPIACARTNRNSPAVERIQEALLSIDKDQQGQEVLAALHLDGFTTASPNLFESIARNFKLVQAQS
ncbi:MAG: PhnD/SsuA/transferrin family substrate-binding protein [Rhodospirillales bacterium]|nr:PhnD/SsuA/transferrin family substrate-binding protein [Rhodospirillales bacterium]